MTKRSLAEPCAELGAAIGSENVLRDAEALGAAARNTYGVEREPLALVRPGSTAEVVTTVRWAARHGLSLYPSSRGRNWGYGSRVPPPGDVVLVELGRMDAIVELDPELAYVRIQPGVSFDRLRHHLEASGARVLLSAIGGPADSSLVGNIVERGLGKGVLGDRFANACNLEVVLADGEVIRTGFGAFEGARAAAVHRWGLGPAVDGLFTQSSLGIVTEATLWLQRRAAHHVSCIFWVDDDDAVGALVDAVRELKLEGTVLSTSLIANDVRRLSFLRQYPWELTRTTPMPDDVRRRLRQLGAWCGDLTLYGATVEIVAALRARVGAVLGPLVTGIAFSDALEGLNETAQRSALAVHALASGKLLPTAHTPLYWRVRAAVGDDPKADRCGLLWFAPAVPMRAEDANWAAQASSRVLLAHGFDANLGLNCFSERAFDCTVMLAYDRAIAGEDERAGACYAELVQTFAARGYYPYRVPLGTGELVAGARRGSLPSRLKAMLDPGGVFSKGRYVE